MRYGISILYSCSTQGPPIGQTIPTEPYIKAYNQAISQEFVFGGSVP